MKSPVVVMVALEAELSRNQLPSDIPLIYSGVGKVNASIATFKAIENYHPRLIVNYGTAGKINPDLSGLISIHKVIQRDIMAEPLAPRGTVPFSKRPNQFVSKEDGFVCGTGDSFVTQRDLWLTENGVDVVDMELFAIAAVATDWGIDWTSLKYISDAANESSGHEWKGQVHQGQLLFSEWFTTYL
ncbi:MAG: 5'-methylthioadenosine nucleosidase [Betaproteobacteria bacterium]|nr:5'-methylthioadenosine nucleosidase [Betaproteobacteria bacterium]NBY72745.1 5'-methylthioadenosine nucleosidase [Betaproteobacteria bacterium]NDD12746.1 5'-methylthioadenosine nucleosidase [Betaproteobacteria bacterium]